jgi:lipooligosaccharide transport system permease protein
MSIYERTRKGSLTLVDTQRVHLFGAFFVSESRFKHMAKWLNGIITQAIANPLLYLLSVGVGIGSLVDANQGSRGVDGVPYLTFLGPALLASTAIQGAIDEVVMPTMQGFKWNKNFFAMNATPLTGKQIANGVYIAALVRVAFTVAIYWVLLFLFGALKAGTAWLAIAVAMFAGAAFGAMMLAIAGKVVKVDFFFSILGRFIIMPLFLFSGTFYPLSTMPIFLQPIGWISPLWHATELGRYFTYGHSISGQMLAIHISFLAIILVIGIRAAQNAYTNRLAK